MPQVLKNLQKQIIARFRTAGCRVPRSSVDVMDRTFRLVPPRQVTQQALNQHN